MNFTDITTLNITTELDVLKRDTQRNSFLLYQHKGDFIADSNRIGNVDQTFAKTKFIKVLDKAKQDNIALVVSPEYSCPKSVVTTIVDNENLQPGINKIWALGGESLNKVEIAELLALNSDSLLIHCEDVFSNSDKTFLDPLYYIFRGVHDGHNKLIILIQFKTWHMGGLWIGGQVEADNLIEGNTIYVIKNSNSSTRLISFICSEAMNVRASLTPDIKNNVLDWNDKPFLILNPQINPNPSHPQFIHFRNFILEDDKKELISLNWGKETYFKKNPWYSDDINTPRSGIFFKTLESELDHSPQKIIKNHKKGFYFLHLNRNKFVYFINGKIELIKIENKSVDISEGVAQQRRRDGPEAMLIYNFDVVTTNFIEQLTIDDLHIDFFTLRGISNNYLLSVDNSIVDKERLINISTGKVIGIFERKWSDVVNLNSFSLIEADECNCRMTYLEDTYESSALVRANNCANIIELDKTILPNKGLYPHSIKNLKKYNLLLSFAQNAGDYSYKYNLTEDNGIIKKATISYLGNTSPRNVEKAYAELQNLFEQDSTGKDTVVVFYRKGLEILEKSNPDAGDITSIPTDNISII